MHLPFFLFPLYHASPAGASGDLAILAHFSKRKVPTARMNAIETAHKEAMGPMQPVFPRESC